MMSNLAINTAQAQAAQQQQAAARPRGSGNGAARPTPTPLTSLHVARSREDALDLQMLSPLSPDVKRRRFNQQTYVPPSSGNRQPPPPAPGTPYPFASDPRRQSLPRPDILRGPSSRHGSHDAHSNLTLPPLQTGVATATPAGGGAGSPLVVNGGADPQGRSVEAVVMGMPFWGKIRVLGKIAPPWRPAAREPAAAVRGAIVAVEGDDGAAVVGMSRWLEENLNKTGETHARVAEAPRAPPEPLRRSPGGEGSGGGTSLGEYIDVIAEWHGRTREMVEFITRAPGEEVGTPTPTERMVGEGAGEVRTPVLIMPTYNLGAADAWASRISITDNYSPADHWQWVATLWRGIVGPDITIYIRDVQAGELEMTGGKAVEVREDGQTKCLIVKRAVGKEIDESAMRRLGFEVGELIRGVSGLNGK
ncbi:putative hmg-box transcription factor protein [Neofusicoccum parvum UCRNP2]|uniref:Putative hmg-box transcription factor protein n=1 Tax=Botryosphaeria parva (strain UCR-NP2) TaxID=1287680 RepID=R1EF56_BOTPV|nr:putative hmg-box transcription factor protein [Neofusicoccum parvum UCRNP2]